MSLCISVTHNPEAFIDEKLNSVSFLMQSFCFALHALYFPYIVRYSLLNSL